MDFIIRNIFSNT